MTLRKNKFVAGVLDLAITFSHEIYQTIGNVYFDGGRNLKKDYVHEGVEFIREYTKLLALLKNGSSFSPQQKEEVLSIFAYFYEVILPEKCEWEDFWGYLERVGSMVHEEGTHSNASTLLKQMRISRFSYDLSLLPQK